MIVWILILKLDQNLLKMELENKYNVDLAIMF